MNRIKLYYLGNPDSFDYGNIAGIYYDDLDFEFEISKDKFENSLKDVVSRGIVKVAMTGKMETCP